MTGSCPRVYQNVVVSRAHEKRRCEHIAFFLVCGREGHNPTCLVAAAAVAAAATTAATAAAVAATTAAATATAAATTVAAATTFATATAATTTAVAAATTGATATATAATTVGAAETSRTLFTGASFVHHDRAASQRLAVHAVHGSLSFRIGAHFDKTEAL